LSRCAGCSAELPTDSLVCRQCHTLVHTRQLAQLSASAKALEKAGNFSEAREEWLRALALLPADSTQSLWITQHVHQLDIVVHRTPAPARKKRPAWLDLIAPLVIASVSFGAFLGVYWSLYGFPFALGFAVQILIHEMGHYIDVKRRGLPADLPMFLPGLGAYVRWKALGVSLETRAAVSLAGPLAGCLAAAFCAWMWFTTGNGLWAALAGSGATLNLLNLSPAFGSDGDHAFQALTRNQRAFILASSVVLFMFAGGILFLVALGTAWRLFTNDFPEQPSVATLAYFTAVLCALAVLAWLVPFRGLGTP
jgi:Zn-dependent protease